MPVICPTVTTDDPHVYREEVEQAVKLTGRVHIDLADGDFAPAKLIAPDKVWWPEGAVADIHLMYRDPLSVLDQLIALKPRLIVLHAEADGDFAEMVGKLKSGGVMVGLALLPETELTTIRPVMADIDHILVFSGHLGFHGGHADLSLLGKVTEIKVFSPVVEVGWDGGINDENARTLVRNGVDVLNVGGFIQKATHPEEAYATLKEIIDHSEDPL